MTKLRYTNVECSPASHVLKDYEIAWTINELRDIAVKFHDTQQLCQRIAQHIVPLVKGNAPAPITAAG
jgi:hypothetical protein